MCVGVLYTRTSLCQDTLLKFSDELSALKKIHRFKKLEDSTPCNRAKLEVACTPLYSYVLQVVFAFLMELLLSKRACICMGDC